jgi:flagellar basal body-associated protein FliL
VALRLTQAVTAAGVFSLYSCGTQSRSTPKKGGTERMSILWIILIVILVLALLGFFSRGYW